MSDGLNVNIQAEQFLAKLRGTGDRLNQKVEIAVTRLSIQMQNAVKDKLSGGVLHVQTGTLRRSINREVHQDGSSTTATVGTNVKYAAIHEFGFTGDVTVPAHTRNIRRASGSVSGKLKKGKVPASTVEVRQYVMHMNVPERSYLRSTLADMAPRIRTDIKQAALDALRA